MPPDSDTPDTNSETPQEPLIPKSEALKAFEARDKAKAEARKKDEELANVHAQLAQYEAKEKAAEEERKRAEGKFDELLAEKEKSFSQLLAEKEEALTAFQKKEAQRQRDGRTGQLKSAILAKAQIDPVILSGLLREAEAGGMDIAPESLTDDLIADAIKTLRGMSEAAFSTKPLGVLPGSANKPGAMTDKQKVAEMLNRHSRARQRQFTPG